MHDLERKEITNNCVMDTHNTPDSVGRFWHAYLATFPADAAPDSPPPAWGFGDSPGMADELGHLAASGRKTATCSLLWEHEITGEPLPQVGQLSIILDGAGEPLCLIETVEVTIKPYNQVDAAFAAEEGEGDRTLAYWRAAHWRYFSRICPLYSLEVSETMPLVCERFRVVHP